MASNTRIYIVKGPSGARLVKATVPSQAIFHVAHGEYSAAVATQDDLVEALSNGIKVEYFGKQPQEEIEA